MQENYLSELKTEIDNDLVLHSRNWRPMSGCCPPAFLLTRNSQQVAVEAVARELHNHQVFQFLVAG